MKKRRSASPPRVRTLRDENDTVKYSFQDRNQDSNTPATPQVPTKPRTTISIPLVIPQTPSSLQPVHSAFVLTDSVSVNRSRERARAILNAQHVLVISGSSTRAGRAVAQELLKNGYGKVVLVRIPESGTPIAEELPPDSDVTNVPMRKTSELEVASVDVLRNFGQLVKLARRCTALVNIADNNEYLDYAISSLALRMNVPLVGGSTDSFYGQAIGCYLQSANGKPCWACHHKLLRDDITRLLSKKRIASHLDLSFVPSSTHTASSHMDNSLNPSEHCVRLLVQALTAHLHGQSIGNVFTLYLTPAPHMVHWNWERQQDCPLCGYASDQPLTPTTPMRFADMEQLEAMFSPRATAQVKLPAEEAGTPGEVAETLLTSSLV
jgi:hypothetical protein